MIVAIDFDGTLVEHEYPHIGREVEGAFDCLRQLQAAGVQLMLWTMRDGPELVDAVNFCIARGITFWSVNRNPGQAAWSRSAKQYAHLYIDDAALGCPLRTLVPGRRPVVDWAVVGPTVLATVGSLERPMGEITPTIAAHVLHHFDGGGIRAGSFTVRLVELVTHADPTNRARLALGFPGYVAAVNLAQNDLGGMSELRRIAAEFGHTPIEATPETPTTVEGP